MIARVQYVLIVVSAFAVVCSPPASGAVGSAFSYQGELLDGDAPVDGTCDFEFSLWDALENGNQVGAALPLTVAVDAGRFTVLLDFGSGAFPGEQRWLQIDVCCQSPCSPSFTPLDPRQELTPVPYAMHSDAPDGHSLDADDGDPVDAVYVDAEGNVGIGTSSPERRMHVEGGQLRIDHDGAAPAVMMVNEDSGDVWKAFSISAFGYGPGNGDLQFLDLGTDVTGSGLRRLTIKSNGRVGINNSNPSEMLSVAGTVEAQSGGFKFPDGTVQSTAAGASNTLDAAYDQGGAGAGRTITADFGPVEIQGPDGLIVEGTIRSGSSIIIDGSAGAEKIISTDALEIHTSSGRAMRLEPELPNLSATYLAANVIAGPAKNIVTSGAVGATISGGGATLVSDPASVADRNIVTDDFGTIGGGMRNQAGNAAGHAADSSYATVSGGLENTATGRSAMVGGGESNTASGSYSAVAGGRLNFAGSICSGGTNDGLPCGNSGDCPSGSCVSGSSAVVAGGSSNKAIASAATVGGGVNNVAEAINATVGGGIRNIASGSSSTIPGGYNNEAIGSFSFAAGRAAKANHNGTFVWGDSQTSNIASTAINQFVVRAAGGMWLGTSSAIAIVGGRFINTSTGAYLTSGGTWTNSSDRAAKENISPIDPVEVLDALRDVPISTWNYKSEDSAVLHMGPMAQDLHSAFGLGDSDKAISTIDADGVALAAIQGLHQLVEEKDCRIADLESANADLQERLARIEALLGGIHPQSTSEQIPGHSSH